MPSYDKANYLYRNNRHNKNSECVLGVGIIFCQFHRWFKSQPPGTSLENFLYLSGYISITITHTGLGAMLFAKNEITSMNIKHKFMVYFQSWKAGLNTKQAFTC